MKPMILLENSSSKDLVSAMVDTKLGIASVYPTTPEEAIEKIKDRSIDFLITDFSPQFDVFFRYLEKMAQRYKTIHYVDTGLKRQGQFQVTQNIVGKIEIGQSADQVEKLLRDQLIAADPAASLSADPNTDGDFCKVRTSLLIRVSPLNADVFVQLSPTKYLKIFAKGDIFDKADFEKYQTQKKIEFFCLKKEDSGEFVGKMKEDLMKNLLPKMTNPEEFLRGSEIVHETVQELVSKVGFDSAVQDVVKTQVAMAVKTMGGNPKLKNVLAQINRDKDKYLGAHSLMLSNFACAVASGLEWKSETSFQKLSLAAFLHDMTIRNQTLGRVQTMKELESVETNFTPEEVAEFKVHPTRAAEMARKMEGVPADVDTIILQHHEQPDGTGFPHNLGHSRIGPLSAVFIVAHDMLLYALDKPKFSAQEFVELRGGFYQNGHFKKILKSLPEAFD